MMKQGRLLTIRVAACALVLSVGAEVWAAHDHPQREWTAEETKVLKQQFTPLPIPDHAVGGRSRTIYVIGEPGKPPVLLLHELPGLTLECLDFARRLSGEGFRVYVPLLFGNFGERLSNPRMGLVFVRHDVHPLSKDEVSPMIQVARDALERIDVDQPGRRVGVIGMCLSGNFGIPLLADNRVASAVLAQPALPLAINSAHKHALGVSAKDVSAAVQSGKRMLAVHFTEDSKSPKERYVTLRAAFPPEQLSIIDIDSAAGNEAKIPQNAHAVLTEWYSPMKTHPTHKAFDAVVQLLQETVR